MGASASSPASAPEGGPNETSSLTGKGPKDLEGRKCTDVLCLLLIILNWLILLGLGGFIFSVGDANKVYFGTDYMGNTCGHSANTTGKSKVIYPRIGEDMLEQSHLVASGFWWDVNLYGVCAESCPVYDEKRVDFVQDYGWGWNSDAAKPQWGVYMSTVDLFNRCLQETTATTVTVDLCAIPNCTEVGAPCYSASGMSGVSAPEGAWVLGSDAQKDAQCAREVAFSSGYQVKQPGANAYLDWIFLRVGQIKDTSEELYEQAGMIFVFGGVLALVVNFTWLVFLFFFAKLAVWASIISILVGTFLGSLFCFIKGGGAAQVAALAANSTEITQHLNVSGVVSSYTETVAVAAESDQIYWTVGGAVCGLAFITFLLIVCCSCKAIQRCIVLVEQGSICLGSNSGLSLLPIVIAGVQMCVFGALTLTLLVLTTVDSVGNFHERLTATSPTTRDAIIGVYLLFGAVWTCTFLTALELMTTAACTFYYYFVNKSTVPPSAYMKQYDDNQTSFPVLTHLGWVVRYHLGTIAFGSLIVAIVTMIQILTKAAFEYLEKNTPAGSNPMVKLVARCVECCLWCFKKTIEFVNSYAYIYCFVENIGFCSGCMRTFGLIMRYPGQIAINTTVQAVLALLLSLTTPLLCGVVAFVYFDFAATDAATHTASGGLLLPGAVVVLALVISRAFASVWEQVIQSLTVCVLHDVDNFDGRFLRESMVSAFGDPKKAPPAAAPSAAPAGDALVSS